MAISEGKGRVRFREAFGGADQMQDWSLSILVSLDLTPVNCKEHWRPRSEIEGDIAGERSTPAGGDNPCSPAQFDVLVSDADAPDIVRGAVIIAEKAARRDDRRQVADVGDVINRSQRRNLS